jgi:hypothetical protein
MAYHLRWWRKSPRTLSTVLQAKGSLVFPEKPCSLIQRREAWMSSDPTIPAFPAPLARHGAFAF